MRKELSNKILKNYVIIILYMFITEIIFRLVNGGSFFGWALIRIFIYCNIVSLIISLILSFILEKINKWLIIIYCAFVSIYSFFQLGFYTYIGTYMSVNSSSQAGKVLDYIGDFISSFSKSFYLVLIPLVAIILYYILIPKKIENYVKADKEHYKKMSKKEKLINQLPRIISIVTILVLCFIFYLTLIVNFMQNKFQIMSNKELFKYTEIQNVAVNQFGINGFCFLDLKSMFSSPTAYAGGYHYSDNTNKETSDNTRVIDDSAWIKIIENETNSKYNNLNNYFISKDITVKNEYTGLFEGKNLIIVLMESVNDAFIEYPEYFPTIAKFYNEGWSFSNNFSPRNSCATGNNEMSSMTSLYTINNSCTANTYKYNTYPAAIFNLFNNKGYYTSSYHDYIDAYYSRNIIHINMGSSKYSNASSLGIVYDSLYQEWPSDTELFTKAVPEFINKDHFMSYLTTVTSHRPYGVASTYGNKNLDLFKDLDVSLTVKRYLSKLKELDLGLEILYNQLEESGKLDDTVIVLLADHYPYGLSDSQVQSILSYDISENKDKDRTPLIIYNPDIETKKFTQYTTYINLLPTLANLFNLDYDPRLYFGTDVFSDDYQSIAVFADGSWQNEIAYYNANDGKINYQSSNEVYTDEEIISINKNINTMIGMSNNSIRYNYFNYLEKETKKYLINTSTSDVEE